MNESFFTDAGFKIYKAIVKQKLAKFGIDVKKLAGKFDEWCADFYEDDFSEAECAMSIRDNFRAATVNEDFGMGVGSPCGLDQGIPHGGDCKGCNPCMVASVGHPVKHPPKSAAMALTPGYWLSQIPRKKKKKKKLKKNLRREAYEYLRPVKEEKINESFDADWKFFCDEIKDILINEYNMTEEKAIECIEGKYNDDVICEFDGDMDEEAIAAYIGEREK